MKDALYMYMYMYMYMYVHILLSSLLYLSLLSLFPFLSLMLVCYTHVFSMYMYNLWSAHFTNTVQSTDCAAQSRYKYIVFAVFFLELEQDCRMLCTYT